MGVFSEIKNLISDALAPYNKCDEKKYVPMKVSEWDYKYLPLMDEASCQEMRFHWAGSEWDDFQARLEKIEPDVKKRHLHTWTLMTDDEGEMIVCNGLRLVNRMDYVLSMKKWDEDELIVVDYTGD